MTYKIVAYGPRKSCLTWAEDSVDFETKKYSLEIDGYTNFSFEEE